MHVALTDGTTLVVFSWPGYETQSLPTHRRIGLAIVAKIDRPYGRDDDVLCRALAKARDGWIRLE
jgi:hypothetical protein